VPEMLSEKRIGAADPHFSVERGSQSDLTVGQSSRKFAEFVGKSQRQTYGKADRTRTGIPSYVEIIGYPASNHHLR